MAYDPILQLDQRIDDEGGEVRQHVRARWRGSVPVEQRELIVLVHGFNNSRSEAMGAYIGLRDRQRRLLGEAAFRSFDDALGDDFWPGDANWGLFDFADPLVYPRTVRVARDEVAPRLAAYLRRRDGVQAVHFLAHSLGCRVVLEVLTDLAEQGGGPPVGRVCLMAAAVPVSMLLPGGRLEAALSGAGRSIQVLYSPDDEVLSGSFPWGQTLATGGEGWWPEAVGLRGDVPFGVDAKPVAGARHGDYWGHSSRTAATRSARLIERCFGYGHAPPHGVEARAVATVRSVGDDVDGR